MKRIIITIGLLLCGGLIVSGFIALYRTDDIVAQIFRY